MRAEVLLRAAEILRCVHGEPEPFVPEGPELALGRKLRERGRLVVAPLREASERLFAEHVDAAADPAFDRSALGEAGDAIVVELDDAERRPRLCDRDRRGCAARAVSSKQGREVEIEQLVAVECEDVAALLPPGRGKADASTAPEPLWLLGDRDLGAESVERGCELLTRAGVAADDHAPDGGTAEQS